MKPPNNFLTILQFLFSLLAAATFFLLSVGLLVLGITGQLTELPDSTGPDAAAIFIWVTATALFGFLMLPSALFALLSWIGKPYQGLKPGQRLASSKISFFLLVIIFPAALALGWAVSQHPWGSMLALPPIHVLAVGIPVLWLAIIGLRGLPTGSPQRIWGVFSSGLVLSPAISITLEIIAAVLIFIAAASILSLDPEMLSRLERLINLLEQTSDPNQLLEYGQAFLSNPWVISGIFLLIAVVTPLIEEIFKPIGVYLLLHRRISPAEGFAAGLLNGLGFALFESMLVSASPEEWFSTVLLRAPTAGLHGFTTALVGYGLASAFTEQRYSRLVGCFSAAVLIHGVWNGLTLISAGYSIQAAMTTHVIAIPGFVQIIPVILVFLAGMTFLGIILINRRLRQAAATPDLEGNINGVHLTVN
ncbi:MAG: PrsW family intramembrane metalloprotease [Anaerolineales bacterium]|jgi:hypothetical protein|nr:PrsW family intramembrane metalloprotease [Anaerolineales bacterium]